MSDNLTTQVVEENGITSTHGQKSATQESCTQTRDLSFTCQDEKKLLMYPIWGKRQKQHMSESRE